MASECRVDEIKDRLGTGAPSLPNGANWDGDLIGDDIQVDTIVNKAGTGAPSATYGISFPAGQGLDFSASEGGGAVSSVFDDYEEGDFTVTTAGDATGVLSAETGTYTKSGNLVTARISFTVSTNFTSFDIGGLAYPVSGDTAITTSYGGFGVLTPTNTIVNATPLIGTTNTRFKTNFNSTANHAPSTTEGTYVVNITYRTA